VIEVKETSPNRGELESLRLLEQRGVGKVTGGTHGDRVRKMIRSASRQLKARSRGEVPTLLVVFDQGRVAGHVAGYHIRVAMYGLEQVLIAVPPIGQGRPFVTGCSHGPKRKMTKTDNTSISAVDALIMSRPSSHHLYVYRNRFARVPLNPELLRPFGVKHFDIGMSDEGRASAWIELAPGHEA
jgi:hypothetical protein